MLPTRVSGKGHHSGVNGGGSEGQMGVRLWRRLQPRLNLSLCGSAPSAQRRRRVVLAAVGLVLLVALLLLHTSSGSGSGSGIPSTSSATTEQLRLSRASLAVAAEEEAAMRTTDSSDDTASTKRRTGNINLTPPLSRETLGHASWSLLHTIAALFPEEAPSLAKQAHVRGLLEAIGELYPCATCARHFRAYMRDHPLPAVLQRASLSEWLCHAHNSVNVRLNKPVFECAAEALALKWPPKLDEDCGCDQEEKKKEEAENAAAAHAEAEAADDAQTEPEVAVDAQSELVASAAPSPPSPLVARAPPNNVASDPLSSDVVAAIAAAATETSASAPTPPTAAVGARNPRLAALVAAALERDRLSAAKAALVEEEEAEARAEQLRDQRQKEREQQQQPQQAALLPAKRIPLRRGEEPAISAMT